MKRTLFVAPVVLLAALMLVGCQPFVVRLYLRATMSGGDTHRYLGVGVVDEVVKPYVVMDYKVLNSTPYKSGPIMLGRVVRAEIIFKSEAGTPLPKLVEFHVGTDNKIFRIR